MTAGTARVHTELQENMKSKTKVKGGNSRTDALNYRDYRALVHDVTPHGVALGSTLISSFSLCSGKKREKKSFSYPCPFITELHS